MLMFDVQRSVEKLRVLVSKPFSGIGRSLNMGILCFGPDIEWQDEGSAQPKTVSEYALHVQCPFRVSGGRRVLLGSEDIPQEEASSQVDRTIFDEHADRLDAILRERMPQVVGVSMSEFGDIRLDIETGIAIAIFPASARSAESWRFFRRGEDHLVFP
jgi:hypothetical protein